MKFTQFNKLKFQLLLPILTIGLFVIGCEDRISTTIAPTDGLYNGRVIATLHGIVKTHDTSEPISQVEVLFVNAGINQRTFTDANGYYRCDNLRESTYTITFISPDSTYADMFEIIEIGYDSLAALPSTVDYHVVVSHNINMYSMNAGLHGYVYANKDFEETIPASGAEVRFTDLDGILNANYSAVTSADGYYSFDHIPAVPSATLMVLPWESEGVQYSFQSLEVETIAGGSIEVENVFVTPAQSDVIVLTNNFANGSFPVEGNIEVGFSRPLLEDSWTVQLLRDETEIPVITSLDQSAKILSIDPTVILQAGSAYSLSISGRDINYGQFEYGPVQFVTELGIVLESTNLSQADGVIRNDVGLDETITFTFNRQIDVDNFNNQVILTRDDVDVLSNWEFSEDHLTLEVHPEGSFRIGTEYEISYSVSSMIPYDFTSTLDNPFVFQTSSRGDPPTQVVGLEFDAGFARPDWDTTTLQLRWNAIIGADHYDVYGSDNYGVIDNIYLGRIISDRLFGAQTGEIQLPPEFDWIDGDAIQTPFTQNIQITLQVRAVNEYGIGQFSSELVIRDDMPPTFEIRQFQSANNSGSDAQSAIALRFSNQVEYCDAQGELDWGLRENGGDAGFTLSSADGWWQWDENYRNGRLNLIVPSRTDGSGDLLWMVGLRDASGNVQSDTIWIDLF